ncbi:MAG: L-histidine N(alpha)-methyltransferase [Hymenobacter sp.]
MLFLGSNIGNFAPAERAAFLAQLAAPLGAADRLLIGFDLQKDPRRIRAAYDDAQGVTAAFNLNLLARLNRELGADFDLAALAALHRLRPADRRRALVPGEHPRPNRAPGGPWAKPCRSRPGRSSTPKTPTSSRPRKLPRWPPPPGLRVVATFPTRPATLPTWCWPGRRAPGDWLGTG